MHNITFDFLGQHRHGSAFHEYLRLRKLCFVDLLGWDIPHNDDVEMDQYDNPCSHYSLAIHRGRVVGGARVMPTTATWGSHTYMLRDALRGRLEDIPSHMMASDIATSDVWECTRLVTADSVVTHADRAACLSAVIGGVIDIVTEWGGSEVRVADAAAAGARSATTRLPGQPARRTLRQRDRRPEIRGAEDAGHAHAAHDRRGIIALAPAARIRRPGGTDRLRFRPSVCTIV